MFAFGLETRTKTISLLINRLISEALLVADHVSLRRNVGSGHRRPLLVSDKVVPALQFQSLSPGCALFRFSWSQGESEWCIL